MSAGPVTPLVSLPERVRILLAYLMSGHTLDYQRRPLELHSAARADGLREFHLVQQAEVRIFKIGKEEAHQTYLGFGMDLTHFLLMAQQLTPGDLERMKQMTREE